MSISVLEVAKYFLSISEPGTAKAITHLKLQKLVYYAQGYYLAVEDKPLFTERIEAWVHGPVCPDLYAVYRDYYYNEIPKKNVKTQLAECAKETIDMVWQVYGKYDGPELEQFTHQEDPWINARRGLRSNQNTNIEIPRPSIKSFFKGILYGGV